jgi:hypothetical protein
VLDPAQDVTVCAEPTTARPQEHLFRTRWTPSPGNMKACSARPPKPLQHSHHRRSATRSQIAASPIGQHAFRRKTRSSPVASAAILFAGVTAPSRKPRPVVMRLLPRYGVAKSTWSYYALLAEVPGTPLNSRLWSTTRLQHGFKLADHIPVSEQRCAQRSTQSSLSE